MEVDVLVIDDEPVVRDAIRLVLEAEGLGVAGVGDGRAALAHPALDTCRVVLCDLMLPDCSGDELMRRIAERRKGLPLIAMTGYATAANALAALQAAFEFLPKPFEDQELVAVVRRALEAPKENTP